MKFRIPLIDQYAEEVVYCYNRIIKKNTKDFSMGKRTINSKRNVIIPSLIFGLSIFLLSYTYLFQYPFLISKLAVLKSLVAGLLSGIILSIILSSRFYTKRKSNVPTWRIVSICLSSVVCIILAFTVGFPNNYLFTPQPHIIMEVPSKNEGGEPLTLDYVYNSDSFVPINDIALGEGTTYLDNAISFTPTTELPARASWQGRVWERFEFEFSGFTPGSKVFFYQGDQVDVFYFPEDAEETVLVTTLEVAHFGFFHFLSQSSTFLSIFLSLYCFLFLFLSLCGNNMVEATLKAYTKLAQWIQELSILPKGRKLSRWILWAGVVFFTLWLLNYGRVLLVNPNPAEFREGANLVMTEYLLQGKNPFALENQPLLNTNKGFVYNFTVLPLAYFFGNTLFVHRLVSFIFILLSCYLVFKVLRKKSVPLPFAIAAGDLLLACLLFYVSPIARVDGMGTFLFLASILIPWFSHYDTKSLVISAVLSILAFYTKAYFLLGMGIVTVYLFLFVSKKKGFWYGAITFLVLILSAFLVNSIFECYFLHTIFNSSSIADTSGSVAYMFRQLFRFIGVFWPIGLIYILYLIHGKNHKKANQPRQKLKDLFLLKQADKPLLTIKDPGFFTIFFIISSLAIIFLLGEHRGNYMVYLFQLMAPPFIILIFNRLDSTYTFGQATVPLTILNLAILSFSLLFPNNPKNYVSGWDTLNEYVESSENILNSPLLVSKMIQENKEPLDSGSSEYFYRTQPYADTIFAPRYEKVEQQGMTYKNTIEEQVRDQAFDRLMITENYSPFISYEILSEYYTLVDRVPLYLPQSDQTWTVQIWVPSL